MDCRLCGYYYSDVYKDGFPFTRESCHYPYEDGYAPCELEDKEKEADED